MKRIDPIEYRYGFLMQFRRYEEQAWIHGRRCYSERKRSSFIAFPDSNFPGEIAAELARAVGFGFGLPWEIYGNSIAFDQASVWYKQYLWRDALHPTFPVQEAIAAQVWELLSNSTKPWYRDSHHHQKSFQNAVLRTVPCSISTTIFEAQERIIGWGNGSSQWSGAELHSMRLS